MYIMKPIAQLYAIYFHYAELQHTVYTYACVCMCIHSGSITLSDFIFILFLFYTVLFSLFIVISLYNDSYIHYYIAWLLLH